MKVKSVPRRRGRSEAQPVEWEIPLRHRRQEHSWDCGLACVRMVLGDSDGEHFRENLAKLCREEGFNKSTWTIDLCFLLSRYDVPYRFYTLTLGVWNGYKQTPFYEKVFSKDEQRVNRKFEEAALRGYRVSMKRVGVEAILSHLPRGPVIALTNSRLLSCERCKHNSISNELRKCLPSFVAYQGHYVVVCGYDVRRQVYYYRNPAFSDHVCCMKFSDFEEARKCFGTDEDVIFVYNKRP